MSTPKLAKYVEACAGALYRVTKEFAAKSQVDMARAKNDMEEHLQAGPATLAQ